MYVPAFPADPPWNARYIAQLHHLVSKSSDPGSLCALSWFMHAYGASRCERRLGTQWSEDEYLHHQRTIESSGQSRYRNLLTTPSFDRLIPSGSGYILYFDLIFPTMLALSLDLALPSHSFSVTKYIEPEFMPCCKIVHGFLCHWVHLLRLATGSDCILYSRMKTIGSLGSESGNQTLSNLTYQLAKADK